MTNLMSIFRTYHLEALKDFNHRSYPLGIVKRTVPPDSVTFFEKLMSTKFKIFGNISKDSALNEIRDLLDDVIADELQSEPFYQDWLHDMAEVCKVFCDLENSDAIGFWLGSERGCRRYHIDFVPQRLLVTYAGKGTEWLPAEAADREAFARGKPNENIVKDWSALQFMNPWDVAVFRGGKNELLHRTPDDALNRPSVLMRLDHLSFWDDFIAHKLQNEPIYQ